MGYIGSKSLCDSLLLPVSVLKINTDAAGGWWLVELFYSIAPFEYRMQNRARVENVEIILLQRSVFPVRYAIFISSPNDR